MTFLVIFGMNDQQYATNTPAALFRTGPADELTQSITSKGESDMNASLKTFTDATFGDAVLTEPGPVLVDFWAPWCGPCVALAPVIDELAQTQNGETVVGKLNVDENPDTARRFAISSIPTVLIFRDGEVVHRVVGIRSKEHYESLLQNAAA